MATCGIACGAPHVFEVPPFKPLAAIRSAASRAALLGNSGERILEAVSMDGLLGGNWIRSGESIFYCLVQHLFAVFALRLIADLRYELLRFLLRFILQHFHCISNISAAAATLQ